MSRSSLLAALAVVLTLGPLAAACGSTSEVRTHGTGTSTSDGIALHTSGGEGGRCTPHDSKGKRPAGGRYRPSTQDVRPHESGWRGGRCAPVSHKLGGSVG